MKMSQQAINEVHPLLDITAQLIHTATSSTSSTTRGYLIDLINWMLRCARAYVTGPPNAPVPLAVPTRQMGSRISSRDGQRSERSPQKGIAAAAGVRTCGVECKLLLVRSYCYAAALIAYCY
jgi:hypothetical protein